MSKKKEKAITITVEQAKGFLENVISSSNYQVTPVEFRKFVGVLTTNIELKYLAQHLAIFIEKAPNNFFSTALALEIARVYEKYLDREGAKNIAYKMLPFKNSANQKEAFVFLLNIARKTDNYTEIDDLLQKNPPLAKITTFGVLYELVFYYAYKNDLDKIEELILLMIKKFENNSPVLQTAKILALKYGLTAKFEYYFITAEKTNKKYKQVTTNSYENIEQEAYNIILSERERAFNAIALVDLTNGISHEYGQPVTNIRFNIQYHLKKFEQAGDFLDKKIVEQCLQNVLIQTERISELNKRLAPATSTQVHITDFELNELLSEVVMQEEIKLLATNINVLLPKNAILVTFDRTQMRQILSNLITNSIDSIIEKQSKNSNLVGKGNIWINVTQDKKFKNQTNITCTDNGIGINETIRSRIFNPFYTTKPPDKGQGLGLYIIKNILLKYGGTIRLDAKYKEGAKFIVQIPKTIHQS